MSPTMSEFVRVVTAEEAVPSPPSSPALVTGYEPDRFQKFAIEAIELGHNVLVTAKTGSGKTFVGEYQIAKSLQRGGRIFYTTPVKSLSNQKFHDLKKLFPEASVGIMTGDIKFRPDAQIIVMTTEILRNLLFKRGTATESVGTTALLSLDGLDSVIFDEVHYINDEDRGHVWEECLILLPPSVKLILLSATLSSPYGFAKWLGESKKVRVWLISTLWRAVPLEHCVLDSEYVPKVIYDSKEQFQETTYRAWFAQRDSVLLAHDKFKDKVKAAKAGGHEGPVSGKVRPKSFEHDLNLCLGNLHEKGNLPAIVFVFSRAGCEKLAKKVEHTFIDSSDAAAVSHIWDFHLSRYDLTTSPQAHALKALAMRGIAYHHSGLLPFLKEILEILFSRGLCKVLFATETFAVGINMPTKTVIFTALEKYSDGGERLLKSAEYIQMAGRAGRRGKDDRGLVIYLPQREPISVSEMRQVIAGKSASFASRMNFRYEFLLKMLNAETKNMDTQSPQGTQGPQGTQDFQDKEKSTHRITERALIEKSYWHALEQEYLEGLKKELKAVEAAISLAPVSEDEARECEKYYEIQQRISQNQNAKKKAAQRELAAWVDEHKDAVWAPIRASYDTNKDLCRKKGSIEEEVCRTMDVLWPPDDSTSCNIPSVLARRRLMEEYGYVENGSLSPLGRLASEVNEGHPFLMAELFVYQTKTLPLLQGSQSLPMKDLLTVLALFIGEGRDENVFCGYCDSVSNEINGVLQHLHATAKDIQSLEAKYKISYDPKFWDLSTEWLEPISDWLNSEETLGQIAARHEIFEGNLQKALMKLSGLLDEFQAMATMSGNPEMLARIEEARPLVLRDIVLSESLYLRI